MYASANQVPPRARQAASRSRAAPRSATTDASSSPTEASSQTGLTIHLPASLAVDSRPPAGDPFSSSIHGGVGSPSYASQLFASGLFDVRNIARDGAPVNGTPSASSSMGI